MTVIARRIPSVPRRTAGATWSLLCDLIAPPGSSARQELDRARSVASMLIAEEHLSSSPAVLSGVGPQVRFYTLHGDEAIEGEDPAPVPIEPAEGDWRLSLPAGGGDLALAEEALAALAHITAYDPGAPTAAASTSTAEPSPQVVIDLGELVE